MNADLASPAEAGFAKAGERRFDFLPHEVGKD
jgi:hypothetical protein